MKKKHKKNTIQLSRLQYRYSPDPGTVPEGTVVFCGVCGDKCDERRDLFGARSYAASITGHREKFDAWSCPNSDKKWHKQAWKLMEMADATPSTKIAALLEEEVQEILKYRKPTKANFGEL